MELSVIIPVYNAEKYIARCLESVLNQAVDSLEIICIDDGSTDNSLTILRQYENTNDNISVYTQKNSYAGAARNFGISKAVGEYIHFLDVDDYILPKSYDPLLEFTRRMKADIIKFRAYAYDAVSRMALPASGYELETIGQDLFGKIISLKDNIPLVAALSPVPWGYIVKSSFVKKNKIQFNRLKCVNDRSFYIDIITHALNISFYDDYIVMHKVNDKSSLAGSRRNRENFECCIKSCQMIYKSVECMPKEIKQAVLNNELRCLAVDFNLLEQDVKKIYSPVIWEEIMQKYFFSLSEDTLADIYVRKLYASMIGEKEVGNRYGN